MDHPVYLKYIAPAAQWLKYKLPGGLVARLSPLAGFTAPIFLEPSFIFRWGAITVSGSVKAKSQICSSLVRSCFGETSTVRPQESVPIFSSNPRLRSEGKDLSSTAKQPHRKKVKKPSSSAVVYPSLLLRGGVLIWVFCFYFMATHKSALDNLCDFSTTEKIEQLLNI